MDGLICPVIYNSCLIVSLICVDRIMFCFYWCDDGEKKRVYQNVKSSFSNLHFVTFYMNKAVSELKNYS